MAELTALGSQAPPAERPGTAGRAAGAGGRPLQRWVVVAVLGAFFLLPLVAMVEFTTRAPSG